MCGRNINIQTKCGTYTAKSLSKRDSFSPSQSHETVPLNASRGVNHFIGRYLFQIKDDSRFFCRLRVFCEKRKISRPDFTNCWIIRCGSCLTSFSFLGPRPMLAIERSVTKRRKKYVHIEATCLLRYPSTPRDKD